MSGPYDPHAAALDALAALRWPDVSEPPAEEVEAMVALLRAQYRLGEMRMSPPFDSITDAWAAGREGRPLVPPA